MSTFEIPCAWGCGETIRTNRKPPKGGLGCGKGECLDKHNQAALAARSAPRPRRPRATPVTGEIGRAFMLGTIGRQRRAS